MANETEIKNFFKGRSASYDLFVQLRSAIEKICSPDIEVSKTQISFGEEYKYIWFWASGIKFEQSTDKEQLKN